jgi:hypothetical protein
MESSAAHHHALDAADAARTRLAASLTTPAWFFTSLAAAIAVHLGLTAVGLAEEEPQLVVVGAGVFVVAAGVQVWMLRRRTGVWVGGFVSRVVLGSAHLPGLAYAVGLATSIWAAYARWWWLVASCAVAAGAAYAWAGRRWLARYHAAPAEHARGESVGEVAVLAIVALGGLALLLGFG